MKKLFFCLTLVVLAVSCEKSTPAPEPEDLTGTVVVNGVKCTYQRGSLAMTLATVATGKIYSLEFPSAVKMGGDDVCAIRTQEMADNLVLVDLTGVTFISGGKKYPGPGFQPETYTVSENCLPQYMFYAFKKLQVVVFPEASHRVGSGAFGNNPALKSIGICGGANRLGDKVFEGCAQLDSVHFGAKLSKIGKQVFNNCMKLRKVSVDEANAAFRTEGDWLVSSSGLTAYDYMYVKLAGGASAVTVPDGVKYLADDFMNGSSYIYASLSFPSTIAKLDGKVFASNVNGSKKVVIPDSVKELGVLAFSESWSNLTSVRCEAVDPPVVFPDTTYQYKGGKIDTIVITKPFYHSSVSQVEVPSSSVDAYKAAGGWKEHTIVAISE